MHRILRMRVCSAPLSLSMQQRMGGGVNHHGGFPGYLISVRWGRGWGFGF